jgi:hypothetical protein
MSSRTVSLTSVFTVLLSAFLLVPKTLGADIQVIFTEVPGDPTAVVPGAMDPNGDPATTEFKAMELFSISPDGSQWILKGRNYLGSDLETMLLLGSGASGSVFAQEGQPVHDGAAGEIYDFFGSSPPYFNDLGQFVYTARARGGVSANAQKGIYFDGANFHVVLQQGDPALGLADAPGNPVGDELFGNSFGSFHVLNDGTFGCQDGTIQNIHSSYRPAIFYDSTAFKQSNVTAIPPSIWDYFDSNDFWTTPDGSRWIAQGDDIQVTTIDDILVVDDVVVFREGSTIPGSSVVMADVFNTYLLSNGYWYSRGDDPNDDDWAARNGTLVAATGDPITTGSSEHWTDVFLAFSGNQNGDWVLAGSTDNADTQFDSVIVLNGTDVIVREGDPVDLDGNGAFDDDVYIGRGTSTSSAFRTSIALTDDMVLYFMASLRDGAGNDLGSFGTGGDAFLFVDLAEGCPAPGTSGNYCTADVYPNNGDGVWNFADDGDCIINISDIGELLPNYGTTSGATREDGDIYPVGAGDGAVDISDLGEMLAQYGDDCN